MRERRHAQPAHRGPEIRTRAMVMKRKTGRPVQFELMSDARSSLLAWLERCGGGIDDYAFPSRIDPRRHMSTRQYAASWTNGLWLLGLDPRSMARIRYGVPKRRSSTRQPVNKALALFSRKVHHAPHARASFDRTQRRHQMRTVRKIRIIELTVESLGSRGLRR